MRLNKVKYKIYQDILKNSKKFRKSETLESESNSQEKEKPLSFPT